MRLLQDREHREILHFLSAYVFHLEQHRDADEELLRRELPAFRWDRF